MYSLSWRCLKRVTLELHIDCGRLFYLSMTRMKFTSSFQMHSLHIKLCPTGPAFSLGLDNRPLKSKLQTQDTCHYVCHFCRQTSVIFHPINVHIRRSNSSANFLLFSLEDESTGLDGRKTKRRVTVLRCGPSRSTLTSTSLKQIIRCENTS